VGNIDRITSQLDRHSVYAPALVVLINDQVPDEARPYVEKILDGEGVFWDLAPLAAESWEVYAGLTGFYSQLLRLLGRDVGFDVWSGWQRSRWITSDWHPISREFGWNIACRPLRGVFFRHDQQNMPDALRYLASWPHGWLKLAECRDYAPYLHHRICELGDEIGVEWTLSEMERRLSRPEELTDDDRFELNNVCAGRDDAKVWQFQRGLALFEAMRKAVAMEKDLISVGY
jgi:hypothetical protein